MYNNNNQRRGQEVDRSGSHGRSCWRPRGTKIMQRPSVKFSKIKKLVKKPK